jgi:serine/threonine protein phosphatase PrpC
MTHRHASKTDVGKKRDHNEDAFLVDEQLGLYIVADGMGGHAAGEVASQATVDSIHDNLLGRAEVLQAFRDEPTSGTGEALRDAMELAVRAAAYQVFGLTQVDSSCKGMGTTMSLLLLMDEVAFIAHVGDSRIYIVRGDRAVLATSDHTYVAAMIAQGKMTPEEAKNSRYSNVLLRAVGSHDYVEVDTRMLRIQPGDTFLLCSDGLHGYLKDGELEQVIDLDDLEGSMDALVQLALDRGGQDNITGILVKAGG